MSARILKRKLRACIRGGTYRYYGYDDDGYSQVWSLLLEEFGEAKKFGDFELYEIHTIDFIIRAVLTAKHFTIVKKRNCGEAQFLNLEKYLGIN